MARYIDADELEKHFKVNVSKHILTISDNDYPVFLTDHTLHEIRNAPTADVVPVVRCKDCKYYILTYCSCIYPAHNGDINFDGYCSYGERRCSR